MLKFEQRASRAGLTQRQRDDKRSVFDTRCNRELPPADAGKLFGLIPMRTIRRN